MGLLGERYQGVRRGSYTVEVLPDSARLLRLTRVMPNPWVVGTDMHVRQGQSELEKVRWNDAAGELTVQALRPKGYRGSVFVRAPRGWAAEDPAGLWLAKDGNDGSLIVRVNLNFGPDGRAGRHIRFKRIPEKR